MSTPAPFRWVLRDAARRARYVTPVPARSAHGVVARVYAAAEREFGLLAPPLALHSPEPPVLAAAWLLLRESLLADGGPSRAVKEAVAAGVSLANECPYCVEVHGAVLGGVLDGPAAGDAVAVADGRLDDVADPLLRGVTRWAAGRGPLPAEVPAEHVPQLRAVLLAFHHLNRVVTVFLGDSPLPPALPGRARGRARTLLGRVLRATALAPRPAGADLDLLPAAPPPADLDWARGTGPLHGALVRACTAVDAAAAPVLGASADRLAAALAAALHAPVPLVDPAGPVEAAVPEPERPVARLVALVALAPHRVDDAVVAGFRATGAGRTDAELIAVTAWAALTAARVSAAAAGTAPADAIAGAA